MLSHDQLAILPGKFILVTGANGYIASHVVDQLLAAGYNVRGVVRNITKCHWLSEVFERKYDLRRFELAEVADLRISGALDEAVKGMSGVVHVAQAQPLVPNPDPFIAEMTNMTINALASAMKEPMMQRFVITSSSMAAVFPAPGVERVVTVDTWNEEALRKAWEGPFDMRNLGNVYGAAKMNAEREAFRWMERNKPRFVLNSVLPNSNFGPTVSQGDQGFGSTGRLLKAAYDGDLASVSWDRPQYFVDVRDTGRLHVIALIASEVQNERLFAFAAPYNWNIMLKILRHQFPHRQFPEDIPGLGNDVGHYPTERSLSLLKAFGCTGWIPLEQTIGESRLDIRD